MTSPFVPPPRHRTFWALIFNILCIVAAELFLKTGADAIPHSTSPFGTSALHSPATIVGICFYIAALLFWMYALRTVPLVLAFNFTAINQVLIPIAAWTFLPNEHISLLKWIGIGFVIVGFILLIPMLAQAEHDIEAPASAHVEIRARCMNTSLLIFGLTAELALVTGQLLLKRAMHPRPGRASSARRMMLFALSIAAQALYFFLWVGLLQKNELSSVYPFDAVAAILIVLAAVFFLHERLTPRAWAAIAFIIAGLALISLS